MNKSSASTHLLYILALVCCGVSDPTIPDRRVLKFESTRFARHSQDQRFAGQPCEVARRWC